MVQCKLALLEKEFKNAESLLLEQGKVDEVIQMYQKFHKWDQAISVAKNKVCTTIVHTVSLIGHPLAMYYSMLTLCTYVHVSTFIYTHTYIRTFEYIFKCIVKCICIVYA